MLRCAIFLLLTTLSSRAQSQEIQNTLSYRNLASDHYFRINYENDLAFHTDYYYTQGVHFELVNPHYEKGFLRYLFPRPARTKRRYGIGLESAGYTPMTIFSDSILHGDRPFAGMAYLQGFMIAVNEAQQSRITTTLSLGWMGPSAGGYQIQAFIHRYTGSPDPIGWKYQVKDQVIINYELNYERALPLHGKYVLSSVSGMARAGTLSTKASLGLTTMIGRFDNPYFSSGVSGKIIAYCYLHPRVDVIGYDATLQGGPFTSDNPYTISPQDFSRIVFRSAMGFVIGKGRISLDASAHYLTREFHSGKSHLTAGLALALSF